MFRFTTGISEDTAAVKTIDRFEPSNKDEFTELQKMLVEKITKYEVWKIMYFCSFLF